MIPSSDSQRRLAAERAEKASAKPTGGEPRPRVLRLYRTAVRCILWRPMTPGIKEFHNFMNHEFRVGLRYEYFHFKILSEADLQAVAWHLVREFIDSYGSSSKFKVLNKPYFKDLRIHPDLAIFYKDKPIVLIELKEGKRLSESTAKKEWKRLIKIKKKTKAKRGYLAYVARWGVGKTLKGKKGKGAKYFFELPVTLEAVHTKAEVAEWEEQFRRKAKYILQK